MTDLVFFTEQGVAIPVDESGSVATLDGEYVPWHVRWRGEDRGAPFVRVGPNVERLVPVDDAYKPSPRRWHGRSEPRNVKFAGHVVLYEDDRCSKPLTPWLRVAPANMTQRQFQQVLTDLRALVFALSLYLAPLVGPSGSSTTGGEEGISLLRTWIAAGHAAEECTLAILNQLPSIRRNPSRRLERFSDLTDVRRAIRRGQGQFVARQADGIQRVRTMSVRLTDDTIERRFINAVLAELAHDVVSLALLLEARMSIDEQGENEARDANASRWYRGLVAPVRAATVASAGIDAAALVRRLRLLSEQLGSHRAAPSAHEALLSRTNRLLMSKEYRPALLAWEVYQSRLPTFASAAQLVEQIDEHTVGNTATLYERWVTVKLYTALIERGFRPPPGEGSLLDRIELRGGEVAIDADVSGPLVLTRFVVGERVTLRLFHDRQLAPPDGGNPIRPDLLIEAETPHRSQVWVFDAKYKNYRLPAPAYQRLDEERYGSHFRSDVEGVAEVKYRRRLRAQVGGIIHPDTSDEFTFWDDAQNPPSGDRMSTAPQPHSLVAVGLLPGPASDARVTTLLRLLFAQHLGLRSTCWRCGEEGLPAGPVQESRGSTFRCRSCQSFWVDHWCKSCRTRLLKYGRGSFHRFEQQDPFNVHCPVCGDFFSRGSPQSAVKPVGRRPSGPPPDYSAEPF